MLTSEQYGRTLAVLLLYLGLLDGFIKLRSGHSYATLGRDVLLYAICIGIVIRGIIYKRSLPAYVPLTAWVIALMAIVLAEIANPNGGSVVHSLAAVRPHLEFVPLFFLGYMALQSKRRLRTFMVLLLVVALANGIVGLIQSGLSPTALAHWGPGYAADINGTGVLSKRIFVNSAGQAQVRPFGLGSDEGGGGTIGMLALPAGLAIITLGSRRNYRGIVIFAAIGFGGAILGVITYPGPRRGHRGSRDGGRLLRAVGVGAQPRALARCDRRGGADRRVRDRFRQLQRQPGRPVLPLQHGRTGQPALDDQSGTRIVARAGRQLPHPPAAGRGTGTRRPGKQLRSDLDGPVQRGDGIQLPDRRVGRRRPDHRRRSDAAAAVAVRTYTQAARLRDPTAAGSRGGAAVRYSRAVRQRSRHGGVALRAVLLDRCGRTLVLADSDLQTTR